MHSVCWDVDISVSYPKANDGFKQKHKMVLLGARNLPRQLDFFYLENTAPLIAAEGPRVGWYVSSQHFFPI